MSKSRKVRGFRFEIRHRGSSRVETSRKLFASEARAIVAGRKIVAEFADVFRQSASVHAIPNNVKIRAAAKRRKHWGGRTVSNIKAHGGGVFKNPRGKFRGLWAIYAKSGSVRTHFTGKKFEKGGKAVKFSSQTAAYSRAMDLVSKYPALRQTRLTVEKLHSPKF